MDKNEPQQRTEETALSSFELRDASFGDSERRAAFPAPAWDVVLDAIYEGRGDFGLEIK